MEFYLGLNPKKIKSLSPIAKLFNSDKKRSYAGASYNRFTQDWQSSGNSANTEIFSSLRTLRNRSRELARNNTHVKAAIDYLVNSTVGTGTNFQSKVPNKRGNKLNDSLNAQIEKEWNHWAKNCDVSGKLNFSFIERLCFRAVVESGEVIIRKIYEKHNKSRIPLAFEIIEADQLADDYCNKVSSNGNRIIMGVEVDRWGKPVAYWIRPQHPGDLYSSGGTIASPERISADEIIHVFLCDRPGQVRGVPWVYSSMAKLRSLDQYEEALIEKARIEANIAVYMKSPTPEVFQDVNRDPNAADVQIPRGVIRQLAPGEEPVFNPSPAPNSSAVDFIKAVSKHISVGIGTLYQHVTGDYSDTNYATMRVAKLDLMPKIRANQAFFLSSFHEKFFTDWMEKAVLSNLLSINDFAQNPDFYLCQKFKVTGVQLQDPDKEAKAYEKLYELGVITRGYICNEVTGGDYEEVMSEKANEMFVINAKYGFNPDGTPKNEQSQITENTTDPIS